MLNHLSEDADSLVDQNYSKINFFQEDTSVVPHGFTYGGDDINDSAKKKNIFEGNLH